MLAVLSWSAAFYTTRRLLEAAAAAGLQARVIDPGRVVLRIEPGQPPLWEDGEPLPTPTHVIPRIGSVGTQWSLALLRSLVHAGAQSLVPAAGIACARDKVFATQRLVAAGLPVVPTTVVREAWHASDAVESAGGPPVVLKRPDGTQGRGVVLATDWPGARSALEALTQGGHTALVQPQRSTPGPPRDLRVLVIGGRAAAACWRIAPEGEFRTNVHRGASVAPAELDASVAALAEGAASAVGLAVCGVDLLPCAQESPHPWEVLEVNASPGLEGIERATGRDLAAPMIDALRSASAQ